MCVCVKESERSIRGLGMYLGRFVQRRLCEYVNQSMRVSVEVFGRRRWTARLAQQSHMYGMMPCVCCIIFGGLN